MTKDELRVALTAIDKEIEVAEEAARPAREVLKPFEKAISEIEERRELLLEDNNASYLAKCESCKRILFEGDLGCHDSEEGGYFCETCSPTLGECLQNNLAAKEGRQADDVEDLNEGIDVLTKRIAAEGADVKLLYAL